LARRYGVRPSEFLKSDLDAFQFDLLSSNVGLEAEIKANEKAIREAKTKRHGGR